MEPIHKIRSAIDEGSLINISDLAREAGFRCPVVLTAGAFDACIARARSFDDDDDKALSAEETGQLRDLLKLLRHALIPLDGGSTGVDFAVDVLNENRPELPPVMQLCVACGLRHGDLPAITVMLPGESEFADDDRVPENGQELLSGCPHCGGEIQATLERYYRLRGGVWIEAGVDGESRFSCENECDLSGYLGRVP